MKIPILSKLMDERFLMHRLRSTSLAGVLAAELALLLFFYRFYFKHIWSWDLFAVAITFLVVKYAMFAWYRLGD